VSVIDDNERLRRYYDENASIYDTWMRHYDRVMLGDRRWWLCQLAAGRTLELAVGTGLNLPHYAPQVELVAADYSPKMLDVARKRAQELGRKVEFRLEDAHALALPDGSFDTVLTTLFLSSVPEPTKAATEIHRVLRSGGRLLTLDHVRSSFPPLRWLERATERIVAARTGVHLDRDPVDYLPSIGFRLEREQRARLGVVQALVATKP
jgi:ubiquinone/menaquinone biosynthesis C-methylase UbiE